MSMMKQYIPSGRWNSLYVLLGARKPVKASLGATAPNNKLAAETGEGAANGQDSFKLGGTRVLDYPVLMGG
jgi:hypothetical protein